jgi:hypothetical protein
MPQAAHLSGGDRLWLERGKKGFFDTRWRFLFFSRSLSSIMRRLALLLAILAGVVAAGLV